LCFDAFWADRAFPCGVRGPVRPTPDRDDFRIDFPGHKKLEIVSSALFNR
jgi:hypothetical protein